MGARLKKAKNDWRELRKKPAHRAKTNIVPILPALGLLGLILTCTAMCSNNIKPVINRARSQTTKTCYLRQSYCFDFVHINI